MCFFWQSLLEIYLTKVTWSGNWFYLQMYFLVILDFFFFPLFYLLNMVLKIFLIFMIEWQNNTIGSWRHCDMEKAIFKDLELSFWEYIGDEEVKETVSEGNMDDPKSFSFNVLTSYLQKDSFFKNFLFSCKWVNVFINAASNM